ncbi:Mcm2-7 hexameric complex component, partial [Entophlyctis luteolus]
MVASVAAREKDSIRIDLDDIAQFEQTDEDLVRSIENNTPRYLSLFCEVIDKLMPLNHEQPDEDMFSPLEEIIHQRVERNRMREGEPLNCLYFTSRSKQQPLSIREVKGESIGQLVTVKGIVTRVSNVKPQAVVLAMSCDKCGFENYQEVTSASSTTPMTECISEDCKKNKVKGRLHMQTRASKFVKFQEVKIQEQADQVPMGSIPRTMTVHLIEDLVRQVNPGDTVNITGVFMPVPFTGFKAIRANLITDTYLLAQNIVHQKKQYAQMVLDSATSDRIRELTMTPDLFTVLAKSI